MTGAENSPPRRYAVNSRIHDIAVVGAGIIGLAVARELKCQYPELDIVVLDREGRVGQHQTGHNSGVIHSGVFYKPGSLKARLCVAGSKLIYEYCKENEIAYERCGKLIVALDERELAGLDEIESRGRANGVPQLRRLQANEIADVEPGCRGISALHCSSTGITDYGAISRHLESTLRSAGVEFLLGDNVEALQRKANFTLLRRRSGDVRARIVVACAGLWSDRLAVASGLPDDPRIVPFRGTYLTLKETRQPLVGGLVYPVPDPEVPFLGVHVTRHINGEITLGPTALIVGARDAYKLRRVRPGDVWSTASWPGTWRMAQKHWRRALSEMHVATRRTRIIDAAARYVPEIRKVGVQRTVYSGVRAQALALDGTLVDDFILAETPGAIHLRNAPSPAATSSLALAGELVGRLTTTESWQAADFTQRIT